MDEKPMSEDEFDVDSWGKKPGSEQEKDGENPSPERHPNVTQKTIVEGSAGGSSPERHPKTPRRPRADRETAVSRGSDLPAPVPVKILDWQGLEPIFRELLPRKDAWVAWMFRHKKFDKATAAVVIDIYRRLKKEGFD